MKVAIIDDELHNRLVIKNILQNNCPFVEIVIEEGLIDRSIESINLKKPDLVFLDIRLKNGTGFDIIKGLDYQPKIIFTTAYSEYAIKAIRVQAFDYVLKPIDEAELIDSVTRFKKQFEDALIENKSDVKPIQGFYNYATTSGKKTISYDEIYYFESSGSYTFIITKDDKIILSKNIGEVEKEIQNELFFRTHNSFIVNISKIKSIDAKRTGQITLSNVSVIPLSQRKVKEFLAILK